MKAGKNGERGPGVGPVRRRLVAGAFYTAMHNALAAVLVRRWRLPRQGRQGPRG